MSFTKKELESSFVFDLKTEERTWYLVAESEEDMSRWVSSICLLCGFNPTDEGIQSLPHAVLVLHFLNLLDSGGLALSQREEEQEGRSETLVCLPEEQVSLLQSFFLDLTYHTHINTQLGLEHHPEFCPRC